MRRRLTQIYRTLLGHKEILVAVGIALVLSIITTAIFLHHPGSLPNKQNSALTVNGEAKAPNNETEAQKGEELDWHKSINVSNESTNVDGTIIEEIDENQDFAGNVQVPPGWTVQYSCDPRGTPESSRTYSSSPPCPTDEITYLKLTTGTAQTLHPYAQTPIAKPLEEQTLSNGSYKTLPPVTFDNKVFQIMQGVTVEDAGSGSDFTMNCFDLTTYATCTGVTFPTYFSATVGPLGTGTKNINTPINMQSYVDDGSNGNVADRGKLYFPGQRGNSYGVVCVDLVALANCGFTSLGTTGTTYGGLDNPVALSGFVKEGSKLYGHANDADKTTQTIVCYDLNSNGSGLDAPCAGFTANTVGNAPTYWVNEHGMNYYTTGNHIIDNGKLYWIVNYSYRNNNATVVFPSAQTQRSYGTVITCYDVAHQTTCSGWPTSLGGVNLLNTGGGLYTGLERPTTLFAWRNTDNSIKAICLLTGLASGVDPALNCYSTTNGTLISDINGTPGHPAKMFPSGWIFFYWTGSPYVLNTNDSEGSKTYIPVYNTSSNTPTATPAKGATFCWNWTIAAKCADFAAPKYWHDINSGNSGDLGYFYDGACMWGVGYGNKMWSFNAKTGEAPCRVARAKYTATLNASEFYCDGQDHVFNWGKVRLAKASMYDFESLNVVVKNAAGTTVLQQGDLKANSELDLTNVSYQNNQQLYVEVSANVYSPSPWANGNLPFVNIIASSDNAQYCYKTTAKQYCDISEIITRTNASVVTDIDTLTQEQPVEIGLNQPDDEQCFKDVKVSVTSDKTDIVPGDEVTYTIKVDSKANPNIYDRGNVTGARIEATIPSGFSYVSSSDGGGPDSGKAVWGNQTINASETVSRTVTLKAGVVTSLFRKGPANKAYAATSQTPVVMQVAVVSNDDIYQLDNTAQDNSVILTSTTPDPGNGGGTTDPGNGGGNTDPGDGGGTTDPGNGGGNTPAPQTISNLPPSAQGTAPTNALSNPTPTLTPKAIKGIVPPRLSSSVETAFKAVNAAVTPIPPTVAEAIPYGLIAFLVAFAAIYAYQATQAARAKAKTKLFYERFKRTEATRKNYIDLTSHYLNTPITTMLSTVELLLSLKQLPQTTADAAQQRLKRLVGHSQALLADSQALSEESNRAMAALGKVKPKPFVFTAGFIIPVIGVLIVALVANVVFVWAEKYTANILNVGIQAIFFVLAAIGMAAAYNSYRRQREAARVAEQELKLEREVTTSQATFITNAGSSLKDDIIELDQLAPSIVALPKGRIFSSGLASLKDAIAKMLYLNALTSHNTIPVIPNETIKDLADEVIEQLQPTADKKQVKLNVSIEPGLTVLVDIDGFRQILTSTLDNAIKFNHQGGTVDLTISHHDTKQIKIVVKDNGAGIPKEKIDQLFTPFARATSTMEFNYGGFGLDLYMDKLIAEQCGGTIGIESQQGIGTTVTVLLPS